MEGWCRLSEKAGLEEKMGFSRETIFRSHGTTMAADITIAVDTITAPDTITAEGITTEEAIIMGTKTMGTMDIITIGRRRHMKIIMVEKVVAGEVIKSSKGTVVVAVDINKMDMLRNGNFLDKRGWLGHPNLQRKVPKTIPPNLML
jgi:hypothetical protein